MDGSNNWGSDDGRDLRAKEVGISQCMDLTASSNHSTKNYFLYRDVLSRFGKATTGQLAVFF